MSVEVNSANRRAAVFRVLGDAARLQIVDALSYSDLTPGQLREVSGADWNLLAHHLGVLEDAGVIERHRSEGDARRRYVRLRLGSLDDLLTPAGMSVHRPLFICTHNSARSQFAAALWRQRTGTYACSAGSRPSARVHPLAIKTAKEHGVDLRRARPQGYDEVAVDPDVVISVCDRALEGQPPFDAPTLHWSVPDPSDKDVSAFRQAFADIAARVTRLAATAA